MENGKKPASPIVNSEGFVTHQSKLEKATQQQLLSGLDKREHFAGLAMIGLYSMKDAICWTDEDIAKMAVKQSDALLAELEKTEQ